MKLCVQLLFLLTLTFLQESLSTHLETCECHEIRDLVNASVTKAVADLEVKVEKLLNSTLQASLGSLEVHQVNTVIKLLKPIKEQLDYHLPHPLRLGTKDKPAASCKEIHTKYPQAPSGYYWIKQSKTVVKVYCSMTRTCGNETGAWMRVTNIDMRNTSQSCPSGLSYISSPKRLCGITSTGCVSNTFSVHGQHYSKVCGKIIAYQKHVPVAFYYGSRGIDRDYVEGVSLTHGENPRRHIWTFAGASDETTNNYNYKCPCINTGLTSSLVPRFVESDYFCDTALSQHYASIRTTLQSTDPLWDGKGCGRSNTCCSFNTPPWFIKRLPSSNIDNIEMRVCRPNSSGSTPLEIVELYVQ